jgi:tripartite-type tricarboxylate transporter receptor subunit TctC
MIKLTRRVALIAGLAAPVIARAQGFPSRPLRLVVPFPPAGAADITARLVAERMGPLLGQTRYLAG